MECVACRASGLNGPQCVQTPVEDIFCLNARLLHECLAAGHFKCVSAGLCGLDWIGLDVGYNFNCQTEGLFKVTGSVCQH